MNWSRAKTHFLITPLYNNWNKCKDVWCISSTFQKGTLGGVLWISGNNLKGILLPLVHFRISLSEINSCQALTEYFNFRIKRRTYFNAWFLSRGLSKSRMTSSAVDVMRIQFLFPGAGKVGPWSLHFELSRMGVLNP